MHLIVNCSGEGVDWAAWLEAFAVLGTLIVAFVLPRHDRANARKEDALVQKAALAALGLRTKTTIKRLHDRAKAGVISRAELGWLGEESAAMTTIADNVDLTALKQASLVGAFAEVQEAARTAHRRLRQVEKSHPGEDAIPVPNDKFDDPFDRVSRALTTLETQ